MHQTPNDEAVDILTVLPKHPLSQQSKHRIETVLRKEIDQINSADPKKRAVRGLRIGDKRWVAFARSIAAVYLMTFGAVQFVPKIGVYAQAALPSLLGVPPALLKYDPGLRLVGSNNQVQPVGVSSEINGYKVEVLGAYSDDNRTVVFLKTTTGDGQGVDMRPENMILTDQFGLRYDEQGGNASTQYPGYQYYTFKTVNPVDRQLGVHFTLHVNGLMDGKTLGQLENVTGPWNFSWVETSFPQSEILTPDTVDTDNGTQLKLAEVNIAPSSIRVSFDVSSNFTFSNYEPPVGPDNALYMDLTGPDGEVVQSLSGQNGGQFSNGHLTHGTVEGTFAPVSKPGTYTIHVHGKLFEQIKGDWVFRFNVP